MKSPAVELPQQWLPPTDTESRRVAMLIGLLFGLAGMGSSSAAIALP